MGIKVNMQDAITLFQALGISSAERWTTKRMSMKLARVDQMVDDDTQIDDKGALAALDAVMAAIEAGEEIEAVESAEIEEVQEEVQEEATPDPILSFSDQEETEEELPATTRELDVDLADPQQAANKERWIRAVEGADEQIFPKNPFHHAGAIAARHKSTLGISTTMVEEMLAAVPGINEHDALHILWDARSAINGGGL